MPPAAPATDPLPKRRPRRTDTTRLPIVWAGASRTKEGELYRATVRQLTAHVGGHPSAAEALMIGRIAWVQVHMAHIDERAMKDGGLSPHAAREYLAWSNSMAKLIGRLGMKAAPAEPAPRWVPYAARGTALAASGQPPALPASTRAERQALALAALSTTHPDPTP